LCIAVIIPCYRCAEVDTSLSAVLTCAVAIEPTKLNPFTS